MAQDWKETLDSLRAGLGKVIQGKEEVVDQLLLGVLAGGHILIEDVPGVGKTTLAKALAGLFLLEFSRVQFTPDLLPADILGSEILNPQDGSFSFRKGPIFTNVLLADEINRASPRTQSALLEAMNEGQVTIDGNTYTLPQPFCVLATQNPADFHGTYPLPEAQLDRFLTRFAVGYPSPEEELEVLFSHQLGEPLGRVQPVATAADWMAMKECVKQVTVKREVAAYLLELVRQTRKHPKLALGVSTRGALACFRASQAQAFLAGREYTSPHDVKQVAIATLAHRVHLNSEARYAGSSTRSIIAELLADITVPL